MIQVIVRALDILEFIASHNNKPVQLIKIAENSRLSQPTTANIVKTLLEKNYLEQVSRKEGYKLGIASFKLTGATSYEQDLTEAANDLMETMTKDLNETSILAILKNNKRMIIHKIECNNTLIVNPAAVDKVYNTATGRLLMAYLTPKELENFIKTEGFPPKNLWPNGGSLAGLQKELEIIKNEGFLIYESIHHTMGLAVPVFISGKVVAALSVFVPSSRYTPEKKLKIEKLLKKVSANISSKFK
jgi:DNA-binding IclR family transcriptional regulator